MVRGLCSTLVVSTPQVSERPVEGTRARRRRIRTALCMADNRVDGRRHTMVVIGGGAAGYFGAIQAASSSKGAEEGNGASLEVVVLEAGKVPLQKVKISGGGRCNVMHDSTKVRTTALCASTAHKSSFLAPEWMSLVSSSPGTSTVGVTFQCALPGQPLKVLCLAMWPR